MGLVGLTAPEVDILVSWSLASTMSGLEGDTIVVPFNIISGTSMSCPHATSAAAYIKSFHSTLSPSAIKSALMTTASSLSSTTNLDTEYAYGSGQINPFRGANPGLVYDAAEIDYVKFLCGQGYTTKSLQLITGDNSSTCSPSTNVAVWDLNYPSFAMSTKSSASTVSRVFHRTVTNVGSSVSSYKAIVNASSGLKIQVEPSILSFKSFGQKQSFVVTVEVTVESETTMISGSLVWDDGVYQVRSPIVAYYLSRYNYNIVS